jgi:hypothetical protein
MKYIGFHIAKFALEYYFPNHNVVGRSLLPTWRFVSRWYYIGDELNYFLIQFLHDVFVFKRDIIDVWNYKHKTY